MSLSWGDSWLEHCQNALCIHALTEGQPTVEDLKAIRSRLRSTIVEIDREIAAGPLRVSVRGTPWEVIHNVGRMIPQQRPAPDPSPETWTRPEGFTGPCPECGSTSCPGYYKPDGNHLLAF